MKASKEYQQMHGLAATRLRLGLSQLAMALELGISNSLLSLAESGKRSLPTRALVKLSQLEITLEAGASLQRTAIYAEEISPEERRALFDAALLQEERCRLNAQKKQEQLDAMITRYDKLCERINKIDGVLHQALSGKEALPLTEGHLDKHRAVLIGRLRNCGGLAQAELRHKVALLYAEAQLHAADAESYRSKNQLPG